MYELECLRRRIENKVAAVAVKEIEEIDPDEVIDEVEEMKNGRKDSKSNNGMAGGQKILEDIIDDMTKEDEDDDDNFTGHSCLLVTWKTNPEVEKFKELYMEESVKTHKRKSKNLVDPGDLVSEKSLQKSYKILGQGQGIERLLVKTKKGHLEEVDGDCYRYFLLADVSGEIEEASQEPNWRLETLQGHCQGGPSRSWLYSSCFP